MRISISGSDGIMFPDMNTGGTLASQSLKTQSIPAIHQTGGGVISGNVKFNHIKVSPNGGAFAGEAVSAKSIRMWDHSWTQAQSTTYNLITNASSYEDIHFKLILVAYHSSISYQQWTGQFGGYGISTSYYGSGAGSLSCDTSNAGYGTLRLSFGGLTGGYASCYASMMIYGYRNITANVGTLY